jgi:hypothetical protein
MTARAQERRRIFDTEMLIKPDIYKAVVNCVITLFNILPNYYVVIIAAASGTDFVLGAQLAILAFWLFSCHSVGHAVPSARCCT